ncbi:hypothetical protein HUG17_9433 [Dermatophagoides farinae]|uniref:Uncharacterized protein n=1 Tax=Dermatophagoides farinae TaxID=6954 RepID=A0A9D4NUF2_DERFA|nr:mediator of RNA polymerase II transcription subunit 15-like [Dermatophagoides farinae]KAH7638327.1 hypothetical protein HUG17_9433 [Dermatophagoides farinae]
MYQYRILITLLLLAGYWPNSSNGFFWPFTALFGKSSSVSPATQTGPLSEIILRPYIAGDSQTTDLTALSSSSSSLIGQQSNLLGSDIVPLQTQQLPQSNYGYVNLDGSTGTYSSSSSQQQEQLFLPHQQQQQQQQQIEQIPLDQTVSIIPNDPQLQQQYSQQPSSEQQPSLSSYLFNPANLFDSKRFSYITRFKHQRQQQQQQQPTMTTSSTKYMAPNLDQNQYLIIPKPVPSTQPVSNVVEHHSHSQQEPQTNNIQPSQTQSTVQQQKLPANNWVYVSPVNKLNSQQQPIILEAYFQDPSLQHQQNYQVGSIKGIISKTSKQRGSSSSSSSSGTGSTLKIPLLSWLSVSPSQIQLPLQWFKTKSQQPAEQMIDEQPQQQYYGSTIQHQKPLHVYAPGLSSSLAGSGTTSNSYFTQPQSVINNGNSAIPKPTQTLQVPVQSSNQQQSANGGQSVWSSGAEMASTNRLLTGTVHSPQQSSALQFWIETDRQPGRVIFPKPTTITSNNQYSSQQPYQTIQDYQPIRTGSISSPQPSSATVSQVESNQDLGGWDSIPMADIVKPGQQTLQHESSETMDSNIMETMMPSASSDQSIVMNETISNPQQQQQIRETITGQQQQQQSHRVAYQQQQQQQSPQVNSTTASSTTNSRALYNHPQFQSIYQMIQQSQQQQQQQENSVSQI